MELNVILGTVIASLATVAMVMLIHKLASPGRCEVVSAEWLSRFSVAKYRPMERLLSHSDLAYLRAQTGFRPSLGWRLRFERIRAYRGYLKCLRGDYRKLEAAIGLWIASSPKDRPEFAIHLIKSRARFLAALLSAEFHLVLYGLNMAPRDKSANLVDGLDDLRVYLRRVALVRQVSVI